MRREARVVVLRPEYRRFARSVLSRIRAPRALSERLGLELRRRLEEAESRGASPAEAIAAQGDPAVIAADLIAEHGLGPRTDPRRWFPLAAAGAAVVLLGIGAFLAGIGARQNALPAATSIGEIPAHGTAAGAYTLLSADLRGDGHPMLVGMQRGSASWWLVAWDLGPDGAVHPAGSLQISSLGPGAMVAGRFVAGAAQQVVVSAGSQAELVGWRQGRLAVIATAAMPLGLSRFAVTGAPGGTDDLYAVSYANPQKWVLDRLTWNGSSFVVDASTPVGPGAWIQSVTTGRAGGRGYVAVSFGNTFGGVCVGPPEPLQVFDGATLAEVWQGSLGQHEERLMQAPDGAVLATESAAGGSGQAQILRWDGSGWDPWGQAPCRGQFLGLDGAGRALVADGLGLDRFDRNGNMVTSAPWPYNDLQMIALGINGGFVTQSDYVVAAEPSHLAVARDDGTAWDPVWYGTDSTSLQAVSLAPAGRGWNVVDQPGNIYAPAGKSWAWAAAPRKVPASGGWMPFCGSAVTVTVGHKAGGPTVLFTDPAGRSVRFWQAPPGSVSPSKVFTVPLGPDRCDVGIVYQRTQQTPATLQILKGADGTLRPVAGMALPPPPPGTLYGVHAEVPGRGRVEIVLSPEGLGGVGQPQTAPSASFLWDGRRLELAGPVVTPGQAATFAPPVEAGGRWLLVGLAQAGPSPVFFGTGQAANAQQTPRNPVRLLIGRLQNSGRVAWRTVSLPTQDAGQVTALPVPDGSGRILLTVAGRTFVYRAT